MSNWQEKKDPEINNAVKLVLISKHEKESDFDKFFLELLKGSDLDYCNNPAFSWPIILSEGICITSPLKHKAKHFWYASWNEDGGRWSSGDLGFSDKNPLRAAMIVFLMMNEK